MDKQYEIWYQRGEREGWEDGHFFSATPAAEIQALAEEFAASIARGPKQRAACSAGYQAGWAAGFAAQSTRAERNQPMKQQAYQPGLFEQTPGPPDLIAECGILSPSMKQIVGAANLSPARQLQVLAELANGQTTARSLNARVAVLARQQAQGAADGDQMQWGR